MTSDAIRQWVLHSDYLRELGIDSQEAFWLREIAFQLALLNEKDSLAHPVAEGSDRTEGGGILDWLSKIAVDGSRYGVTMLRDDLVRDLFTEIAIRSDKLRAQIKNDLSLAHPVAEGSDQSEGGSRTGPEYQIRDVSEGLKRIDTIAGLARARRIYQDFPAALERIMEVTERIRELLPPSVKPETPSEGSSDPKKDVWQEPEWECQTCHVKNLPIRTRCRNCYNLKIHQGGSNG